MSVTFSVRQWCSKLKMTPIAFRTALTTRKIRHSSIMDAKAFSGDNIRWLTRRKG